MTLPLLFLLQEHAEEAEHAAGALPAPFSPTPGLFIWTIIVFGVLLFLLRKLVFPMLVKATVDREQQINNQLAEAARMQDEAKAVLEDVVRSEPRVLAEPAPQVLISELTAKTVILAMRVWIRGADYSATKWALTEAGKIRLEDAKREVHPTGSTD